MDIVAGTEPDCKDHVKDVDKNETEVDVVEMEIVEASHIESTAKTVPEKVIDISVKNVIEKEEKSTEENKVKSVETSVSKGEVKGKTESKNVKKSENGSKNEHKIESKSEAKKIEKHDKSSIISTLSVNFVSDESQNSSAESTQDSQTMDLELDSRPQKSEMKKHENEREDGDRIRIENSHRNENKIENRIGNDNENGNGNENEMPCMKISWKDIVKEYVKRYDEVFCLTSAKAHLDICDLVVDGAKDKWRYVAFFTIISSSLPHPRASTRASTHSPCQSFSSISSLFTLSAALHMFIFYYS